MYALRDLIFNKFKQSNISVQSLVQENQCNNHLSPNMSLNSVVEMFGRLNVSHDIFAHFVPIRVFHGHTELTKMTILASQALLCENKKKSATKCYPTEH